MNTIYERKERDQLIEQEPLTAAENQFVVNIQVIEAGFLDGEHKSQAGDLHTWRRNMHMIDAPHNLTRASFNLHP